MKDFAFPQIPRPKMSSSLIRDLAILFDREAKHYHRIAIRESSPAHWHEAMRLYNISDELKSR
jgi:hypothetical protein